MKSVLVTGGSGFVGRHALTALLHHDCEIHAVFSQGLPSVTHARIHWHEVDLHNAKAVHHLLQQITPDHLLHLAWFAKPKEYWTSPVNIDWIHCSINLLNAFIKVNGKRAVFTGTCAEYDWQHGHCKEFLTPCMPSTLYGRAKHALHLLSEAIAKTESLSFAWARLFFLFGDHEYKERLIPSAICSLLAQKEFDVMNGHQIRDFMCVTDVANALIALLDSDITGPVNIASGNPMTLRELINRIAEKLNAIELVHYREGTVASQDSIVTADTSRLVTEVKWQPQYSLDNALENTISWWSKQI